MGRGLDAILSVSSAGAAPEHELRQVEVEQIAPNPRQPREAFDEEALVGCRSRSSNVECSSRSSCARPATARTSWSPASAAGVPRGSPA